MDSFNFSFNLAARQVHLSKCALFFWKENVMALQFYLYRVVVIKLVTDDISEINKLVIIRLSFSRLAIKSLLGTITEA